MVDEKKIGESLKDLGTIDKVIHEPARLLIMSYLYVLEKADFLFLRAETDLTWGNLSSHITKLENVGYVKVEKKIVRKKTHTLASLTNDGRKAFEEYREKMKKFLV